MIKGFIYLKCPASLSIIATRQQDPNYIGTTLFINLLAPLPNYVPQEKKHEKLVRGVYNYIPIEKTSFWHSRNQHLAIFIIKLLKKISITICAYPKFQEIKGYQAYVKYIAICIKYKHSFFIYVDIN